MPLYEYECARCHQRFEKLQRFSDPPPDECPACGGPLSQLLSPPAIQFKGSGWYVTDYARKSAGSAPSGTGRPGAGDSGATPSPPASAETKSEKK